MRHRPGAKAIATVDASTPENLVVTGLRVAPASEMRFAVRERYDGCKTDLEWHAELVHDDLRPRCTGYNGHDR